MNVCFEISDLNLEILVALVCGVWVGVSFWDLIWCTSFLVFGCFGRLFLFGEFSWLILGGFDFVFLLG